MASSTTETAERNIGAEIDHLLVNLSPERRRTVETAVERDDTDMAADRHPRQRPLTASTNNSAGWYCTLSCVYSWEGRCQAMMSWRIEDSLT